MPRLRSPDLWQVVYTEPPFHFPPGVTATYHPGKPISPQEAGPAFASDLTHNWSQYQLQSARYPLLGFVVEGVIDWRVGITARMAMGGSRELRRSNYLTLAMPKGTFFLMPPGVPYFEPDREFWTRSLALGMPVRVLWMQFHPFGIHCFMNYTVSTWNVRDSAVHVADTRTIFAVDTLIEELNRGQNCSSGIVHSLLQFCLQRLERGLMNEVVEEPSVGLAPPLPPGGERDIVERACLYIEAHFDQKVTTDLVAAQVAISRSHLALLFQREKGMGVNEYLTRFRMEHACTLLGQTDLRINHIGKISGYRNHSYFCQAFQRRMGCSPLEFREKTLSKTKAR